MMKVPSCSCKMVSVETNECSMAALLVNVPVPDGGSGILLDLLIRVLSELSCDDVNDYSGV